MPPPDPDFDPDRLHVLRRHAERLRTRLTAVTDQAGELRERHDRLTGELAEAETGVAAESEEIVAPPPPRQGSAEAAWGVLAPRPVSDARQPRQAAPASALAEKRVDLSRLAGELAGLRAEGAALSTRWRDAARLVQRCEEVIRPSSSPLVRRAAA